MARMTDNSARADCQEVDNITHFRDDTRYQRVIIIDDQSIGRTILASIAKKISPYIKVSTFDDPYAALDSCRQFPPDLLITDYRMPTMDGIEVIRQFRQLEGCSDVPIVMVTIIEDRSVKYEALEAGATDFLSRPFDHYECQARCNNLLKLQKHQKAERKRSEFLEHQITQATAEIKTREEDALYCLARAGEFRDECTGNHIFRMAHYSLEIARGLGLDSDQCDLILRSAPMHDIGKIGVPDHILLKPGILSPSERVIMEKHSRIGHDILANSKSRYLKLGAKIALSHHERFDGTGYPNGLKGEEIPLEARIVTIADVLDALTTIRPYKTAWTMDDSLDYIRNKANTQFDPQCVEALLSREETIRKIITDVPDIE